MNNPFRHRPHDERPLPRHDWDDDRPQARNTRFDEGRSWDAAYGQNDYGPRYDVDFSHSDPDMGRHPRGYRGEYGGAGRWAGDYGERSRSGYFRNETPHHYPEHAYAPGSQIWEAPDQGERDYYGARGWAGRQHDFEPDYLHWRNEQIAGFDRDYRAWRDERRQKFSLDFHSWRQNRPPAHHNESANPIVGEIADGGEGRKARDKI